MAESGVAKATFYRHFDSKDNLVLAYLEDRDRQLWEYLNAPQPAVDIFAALQKFGAVSPAAIGRVSKRDPRRIAGIPRVFRHPRLLCGGIGRKGGKRRVHG